MRAMVANRRTVVAATVASARRRSGRYEDNAAGQTDHSKDAHGTFDVQPADQFWPLHNRSCSRSASGNPCPYAVRPSTVKRSTHRGVAPAPRRREPAARALPDYAEPVRSASFARQQTRVRLRRDPVSAAVATPRFRNTSNAANVVVLATSRREVARWYPPCSQQSRWSCSPAHRSSSPCTCSWCTGRCTYRARHSGRCSSARSRASRRGRRSARSRCSRSSSTLAACSTAC